MTILQRTLTALRPAVVDMIAKAGVSILVSSFFAGGIITLARANISLRMVVYFTAGLVMLRRLKWSPIVVMLLCGVFEVIAYILSI